MLGAFRKARAPRSRRNLAFAYETFPVLEERRTQLAGTMSGGQQQMLAIARALMSSPRLLLVDEPSVGLSPLLVSQTITKIEELKEQLRPHRADGRAELPPGGPHRRPRLHHRPRRDRLRGQDRWTSCAPTRSSRPRWRRCSAQFGVSIADIGVLIGLYFAPGVVLALPGGAIGQKFGDKTTVLAALLLMLMGSLTMALRLLDRPDRRPADRRRRRRDPQRPDDEDGHRLVRRQGDRHRDGDLRQFMAGRHRGLAADVARDRHRLWRRRGPSCRRGLDRLRHRAACRPVPAAGGRCCRATARGVSIATPRPP